MDVLNKIELYLKENSVFLPRVIHKYPLHKLKSEFDEYTSKYLQKFGGKVRKVKEEEIKALKADLPNLSKDQIISRLKGIYNSRPKGEK